jgi:hypothetical protein
LAFNALRSHPEVYVPPAKEIWYFDKFHHRGRDWYLSHFQGADERHRAVGELCGNYLYSEAAPGNILNLCGEIETIAMLRNPVDMVHSWHSQMVWMGNEPIEDFATAWQMQPKRRRGEGAAKWCPDPRLLLYGEICRVGEQLERLYSQVPPERVLVLFLEDVRADPRRAYLRVLDLLGVPDDGRDEFPVVNRAHAPRFQQLRGMVKYLAVLRRRFRIPRFRTGAVAAIHTLNLRRAQVAPLSEAMRRELIDYFRDDVARLARLTGRDLDHWLL